MAIIALFTLFEPPQWLPFIPEPLLDAVGFRPLEMALNVALFVPLGLSLGAWWPRRPALLLAAVAVSVLVETAQLWMPDRVADPVDVVTNSLGAAAGFAVAAWIRRRASSSGSRTLD